MISSVMLALGLVMFSPAQAIPNQESLSRDIIGQWQYDGFLYQSHRYPNPNPDLILIFTFSADGTSRLRWHRENEPGFCERLADYKLRGDQLWQKVTWVNPKNNSDCATDTDMQMGNETETKISVVENELWFHLDLKGEPFMYILKAATALRH